MQYFTLIGGFIGFLLTLAVSFLAGNDFADSVFNATVGCVLVAFLFRALRYTAEFCAKQIIVEKTRIRDEQLAAIEAAQAEAEAASFSAETGGEPKPTA